MRWVLLERYDSIQLTAEPEIPKSNWMRSKRIRWFTVSNATLKLRSFVPIPFPFPTPCLISNIQ